MEAERAGRLAVSFQAIAGVWRIAFHGHRFSARSLSFSPTGDVSTKFQCSALGTHRHPQYLTNLKFSLYSLPITIPVGTTNSAALDSARSNLLVPQELVKPSLFFDAPVISFFYSASK